MRSWLAASMLLAACGKPSSGPTDAAAQPDGHVDAPIDAVPGLSPEPLDPSSASCAGVLGFPGPPSLAPLGALELVVADVDADGKQDIVYVESQRIGWARGVGAGMFAAPVFVAVPLNTRTLRVADIDDDGDGDLLFSVQPQAFVRAIQLMRFSAGTFAAPETLYSASNFAVDQLEVVDMNGDGMRDLVALATTARRVSVLLNTGTAFATPQAYDPGTLGYAWQLAIGDVSGDGRPDIVATVDGPAVSVLMNNGDGTFATRVLYPSPAGPSGIVLADLNEDGRRDVVIGTNAQPSTSYVSVMLGGANGTLGTATNVLLGSLLGAARTLRAGDVNGDGHVDIAVTQTGEDDAWVLFGAGTGQLSLPMPVVNDSATSLELADLDADGRLDMTILGSVITPYLNRGTSAVFARREVVAFPGVMPSTTIRGLHAIDLDLDTRLDLVIAADNFSVPGTLVARRQITPGTFGMWESFAAMLYPTMTLAVDVDNNSRPDVLVLGASGNTAALRTMIHKGDGSLAGAAVRTMSGHSNTVVTADLDGDGRRDALVGAIEFPGTNELWLYPGLGNGDFGAGTRVWSGTGLRAFATLELDGNAMPDVIVLSDAGLQLLIATGNGSFTSTASSTTGLPGTRIFVRDVDRDGNADAIGFTVFDTVVMRGTGTGVLAAAQQSPAPLHVGNTKRTAAFADFNGDGYLDIVATSRASVGVVLGNGDGTFGAPSYYETSFAPDHVSTADIDRDGNVDIVVDNGANGVSVLYGRCL